MRKVNYQILLFLSLALNGMLLHVLGVINEFWAGAIPVGYLFGIAIGQAIQNRPPDSN
jgi:hypothetical protein